MKNNDSEFLFLIQVAYISLYGLAVAGLAFPRKLTSFYNVLHVIMELI